MTLTLNQRRVLTCGDGLREAWFRFHMPYQIVKIEPRLYLPINRNYDPVGVTIDGHSVWKDYADQAMRLTVPFERLVGKVFINDRGYMYNDDPDSRIDYFERLAILMAHARAPKGMTLRGRMVS